ncbi:MAG: riboflavin biosynthesis protein RibF [Prevotella sp.]|nr:riboflavin biosynthesis protein RibF [Prevotella sp.]
MKTIYYNRQSIPSLPSSVATIGMFDGVHRGHRYLISQLVAEARRRDMLSMAVTFSVSPREIVSPCEAPLLLTSLEKRLQLLEQAGLDVAVVVDFNETTSGLSASEFMSDVLGRQLGVACLMIGFNNRFGHRSPDFVREHGHEEGFADYVGYGRRCGIEVLQAEEYAVGDAHLSSSSVRRALLKGHIDEANRSLGYVFSLAGTVVHGEHVGTALGFPTANLRLSGREVVPKPGVYAVEVAVGQSEKRWTGMMNIGSRPTFGGHTTTIEVHLFDFSGDLYGRQLEVFVLWRVRDERRFDSSSALAGQLKADREAIEQRLRNNGYEEENHPENAC